MLYFTAASSVKSREIEYKRILFLPSLFLFYYRLSSSIYAGSHHPTDQTISYPYPSTPNPAMKPSLALTIALAGLGTSHPSCAANHIHRDIPSTIWQPAVASTWQIVLISALKYTSPTVDIFDIDLFDNSKSTIDSLHNLNRKVICYFSAGTYEDWRDDEGKFDDADIGAPLDEWEGEAWVDLRSQRIREIMAARLDIAVEKGCDGVDPDNVDAYDNEGGGLDLTETDSAECMNWLAGEAHSRGLAIGLKNAKNIIPQVIGDMQWSVNEQCAEYEECEDYSAFIEKGKPVFHIEYPKGDEVNDENSVGEKKKETACYAEGSSRFSTLIKNMDLDDWVQDC
ncbi:glycoside hydrolase superfamily [Aspergillus spectabilis]